MKNCMACCICTKSKQRRLLRNGNKKHADSNEFASFANLSKTDSSKTRYIADEIDKIRKGNVSTEILKYRDLCYITNNFNHKALIGEGGFGRVYKGNLKNMEVAIKQLDRNGFQGNKEFLVEVVVLSLLHHPHLVKLVGYCCEGDQRVLVYEYMKNGSLEEHLLDLAPGTVPLDWSTRIKIATGAAKGLEYLHESSNPTIIYRDFKASNILLDGEFNSKLSDFGLAKLVSGGEDTHVSTNVMGTYGYCAPEYVAAGRLSKKSDIYSFGVVFLELITGRRVVDDSRPSEEQNLVEWAQPLLRDKKKFHLMADPKLEGNYPLKGLFQALAIAAMCLQEEAATRPFISDVVVALEFLSVDKSQENQAEVGAHRASKTNVEALENGLPKFGVEMN